MDDDTPRNRTPDAVHDLCRACLAALNSPPVSIVLHGSPTTGDFVPGRSDIDLLVVVSNPLTDNEIDALVATVTNAELGDAAGIDLLVATADACAAPSRRPPLELLVGRYPGGVPEFETEIRVSEFADLVPELAMARESGRALYGAEPNDVIGEVPRAWIEDLGRHWLAHWLTLTDDADNAAFMVLTACRMWRYAVDGVHSSKSIAAHWALSRDPSLRAIEAALRHRHGDSRPPITPDDVEAVLRAALRESVAR